MIGLDAAGFYAVAAKVASFLLVIGAVFKTTWMPLALEVIQTSHGPEFIRISARFYSGLACAGILGLSAFAPHFVALLTAREYFYSYLLVMPIAWSAALFSGFVVFAIGYYKRERPYWLPLLHGIAAALNLAFNFMLVPVLGALGAALSSGLALLAWSVMCAAGSEKLWAVNYPIAMIALQTALTLLSSLLIVSWQLDEAYVAAGLWALFAMSVLFVSSFDLTAMRRVLAGLRTNHFGASGLKRSAGR